MIHFNDYVFLEEHLKITNQKIENFTGCARKYVAELYFDKRVFRMCSHSIFYCRGFSKTVTYNWKLSCIIAFFPFIFFSKKQVFIFINGPVSADDFVYFLWLKILCHKMSHIFQKLWDLLDYREKVDKNETKQFMKLTNAHSLQ